MKYFQTINSTHLNRNIWSATFVSSKVGTRGYCVKYIAGYDFDFLSTELLRRREEGGGVIPVPLQKQTGITVSYIQQTLLHR